MAFSSSSKNNRLLAALPESARQRWLPHLEWVCMPLGQVLHESGQLLRHVYFPVTAMVSLIYATSSGASSAVASIGCEGLVGVEAFMGGQSMPGLAVVQSEGYGFRLPAVLVKKEFEGSSPTMQLLLRYTEALPVATTRLSKDLAVGCYGSLTTFMPARYRQRMNASPNCLAYAAKA
jgi:hypothetical protein